MSNNKRTIEDDGSGTTPDWESLINEKFGNCKPKGEADPRQHCMCCECKPVDLPPPPGGIDRDDAGHRDTWWAFSEYGDCPSICGTTREGASLFNKEVHVPVEDAYLVVGRPGGCHMLY